MGRGVSVAGAAAAGRRPGWPDGEEGLPPAATCCCCCRLETSAEASPSDICLRLSV